MSGINPVFTGGPVTFDVNAVIAGGQLVVPDAGGATVNVAGAGAANVIGVASGDAAPAGTDAATNLAARPSQVAVYLGGVFNLTYAANAVFGDRLVAAAGGQVRSVGVHTAARVVADLTTTTGSAAIGSAAAAQFTATDVGRKISGAGIPDGATIIAVASATSATISANATATATVTGVIGGPEALVVGTCLAEGGVTSGNKGWTNIDPLGI